MPHASGDNRMEGYLKGLVLHYYQQGVRYHYCIVECIRIYLRSMNVLNTDNWGSLIRREYIEHEERFVQEVLIAEGLWTRNQAGPAYDGFIDEEEFVWQAWNQNEKDYATIAAEVRRRFPTTTWFGTTDPPTRVYNFLKEAGRLVSW